MRSVEENKSYYLEWSSSELEITFYPEKKWPGIIFLCVWLIGWAFGELIVLDQLLNTENIFDLNFLLEGENQLFQLLWIIFWTYGGIMAIISLLWEVSGEQYVFLNRESLKIEKKLGLLTRKKVFEIDKILDLRIGKKEKNRKTQEFYRSSFFKQVGYICFHYEGKKIRFGLDIDRTEAESIMSRIKDISRFSDLKIT